MSRIPIVFFFLTAISLASSGQDLIITSKGDSLNCVITKIKKDCVYFTHIHNNKVVSTLLPNDQIAGHQKSFYQDTAVTSDMMANYADFPHLRIAVNGGYSHQIAEIPNNDQGSLENYYKKLQTGSHIGCEAHYFPYEPFGFGATWTVFASSNSKDVEILDVTTSSGLITTKSDDIVIHFVAPSFSGRLMNHNKTNALFFNLAIGYVTFSQKQTLVETSTLTSNALGVQYTVGYDFGISEKIAVGIQAAMFSATLTQLEIESEQINESTSLRSSSYYNLNRADISIGIRFNL